MTDQMEEAPQKLELLGLNTDELSSFAVSLGMPRYAGQQLTEWLYKKCVTSFDEMTNISLKYRELLAAHATIGRHAPIQVQESVDGTKKYLYAPHEGHCVEAVYIPEEDRSTLCISSQMGCKMNCLFCMTGKQGFNGNLTSAEIVNQFLSLPERKHITNIVFMGMGEPLDNVDNVLKAIECLTLPKGIAMSPRRITLSTVGVEPGLSRFLQECDAHLAISLHSPFHEERMQLMPVEKAVPFEQLIRKLKGYSFAGQRRLTFEYIVFGGLNDTPGHARRLQRLLRSINCRVNLIRYHAIPGVDLPHTDARRLEIFKQQLEDAGVTATIRASRGEDILAACGMLSTHRQAQQTTESKS